LHVGRKRRMDEWMEELQAEAEANAKTNANDDIDGDANVDAEGDANIEGDDAEGEDGDYEQSPSSKKAIIRKMGAFIAMDKGLKKLARELELNVLT